MLCENDFCIYNKNSTCQLNEIQLDNQGTCTNCINISLDEKTIETAKKQLLLKLENIDQLN